MVSGTEKATISYMYKGIQRAAHIDIVSEPGKPMHYWFKFKVRPAYFVKIDDEWIFAGDIISDEIKQALIAGLELYINKKALK